MDKKLKEEPGFGEKAAAWQTATQLQAVERLSTSEFLWQISQKHISGKISLDEAAEQLLDYYLEINAQEAGDSEKENADKASLNIVRIILSDTFDLSTEGLLWLNRSIFEGVYENPGELRTSDVLQREWALGGDSVSFVKVEDDLHAALEECIAKERSYRYDSASSDALISHLSSFISEIWRICPFGEGNTRLAALLTILYLRYLGINIKIDTFKNEAWYFHNALVRANYRDVVKNIEREPVYLERFFRNMLLGDQWDLRNRYLHIRPAAEWSVQPNLNSSTTTGQVQLKNNTSKVKAKGKKDTSKVKEGVSTLKEEISDVKDVSKPKIASAENLVSKPEESIPDNPNILFVAVVIGSEFLSVKEIMDRLHLKGRDSFLKLYLSPAVSCGIVSLLYPNTPRHPRQKYLLSGKGQDFLNSVSPDMMARVQHYLANSRG